MISKNIPLVKQMVDGGVPISQAISAALAAIDLDYRKVAEIAEVHPTAVSATINGSTPHPNEKVRNTLSDLLGVTREWIDDHLPRKAVA